MSFFFYIREGLTYIDNTVDVIDVMNSNMFINFNFSTDPYPKQINTLLAMNVGRVTGAEISSLFYKHFVQGMSINEMGIKGSGFRGQVRTILNAKGDYYSVNKLLFDYCMKHYKTDMDKLFNVKTVKEDTTDER